MQRRRVLAGDHPRSASPNALPSAHIAGSYAAVLRAVCAEEARDPYWSLRDNWADEVANALHDIEQGEKVAALVAERDGQPVVFQRWQIRRQLPEELLRRICSTGHQSFVVYPTDVIEVRPRKVT